MAFPSLFAFSGTTLKVFERNTNSHFFSSKIRRLNATWQSEWCQIKWLIVASRLLNSPSQ
jgi:hypothetical protein